MSRKASLLFLLCAIFAGCHENAQNPPANPADYNYTVTPSALSIHENGEAAKFRIHLSVAPTDDVVIVPNVADTSEFSITPESLTLNSTNYAQGGEFTVTPIHDNIADGTQIVPVSFTLYAADPNWLNLPSQTLAVTCWDADSSANPPSDQPSDQPSIPPANLENLKLQIDPQALELVESGAGAQITVKLNEAPSVAVSVTPSFDDKTEFNVSPAQSALTATNWNTGVVFQITPKEDGQKDGDQTVPLTFHAKATNNFELPTQAANITVKDSGMTGVKIRFMAANTTSGTGQDYDDGEGIRMFQAMKPDIILIQEFAYTQGLRKLVDTAFGPEFHYYPGSGGNIPNGIISRYPILQTGTWDSKASDRENEWAIIDIPGDRDMLAVSVHFLRASVNDEYRIVKDRIAAKQKEGNYYVVLGGDFNAKNRTSPSQILGNLLAFKKDGSDNKDRCLGSTTYPVDQNGNNCTSAERDDPYDWILFDPDFDKFEIPVVIGDRSYPNGHVLDSRVYDQHNELASIPPVQADDSWKCTGSPNCEDKSANKQFQHMPVIRDVMFVPGQ